MNNVMLIGKYYHMTKLKNGRNKIFIIIADDKREITLPVYVSEPIVNYIKRCCNEGDLFGIKASVDIDNNELCIVASKLSFISKKA